jgi:hypothetical protein
LERWGSWGTGKAHTPEKGIQKDGLSQAILTKQKKKKHALFWFANAPFVVFNRAPITDHNVVWNQSTTTTVHLIVGKDNILTPCELKLEIVQELNGGKDTHTIGTLMLNLSEYVGSGTTTRRYLLDDCKFNSTLKVCATVFPYMSRRPSDPLVWKLTKYLLFKQLAIRLLQKSDNGIKFEV